MWQRGNNVTATNSKLQSPNAQHAQRRTRDDDRMRRRMTADEVEGNGG